MTRPETQDEQRHECQQGERAGVGGADDEHAEGDDRAVDEGDQRDAADVAARGVPGGGTPDGHAVASTGTEAVLDPVPDRVATGEDVEQEHEHQQGTADHLRGQRKAAEHPG